MPDAAISCRNYRPRTNLFVCTVCRFAVGTPGGLRRGFRRRSLTDAAYPLRVRALRAVFCRPSVGRDHWARRCRNYQLRTNLFVFSVCRLRGRWRHASTLQLSIESVP